MCLQVPRSLVAKSGHEQRLSPLRAADDDPVAAPAFGVEDGEIGKHRIVAQILESESLLAAELAAQAPLPGVGRQVRRFALAREARLARAAGGRLAAFGGALSGGLGHGVGGRGVVGIGLLPIIVRSCRVSGGGEDADHRAFFPWPRKLPSSCALLKRRVFVFGNSP